MVREIQILECLFSSIVRWNLDLYDKSFEDFHEDGELLVLILGVIHEIKSEVFGFGGLLAFDNVGIFLIFEGLDLSCICIIINFF